MEHLYEPRALTASAFAPYGVVVESRSDGFVSVLQQPEAAGWQVGVNRVTATVVEGLHCHPDSWECFSPLHEGLRIAVAEAGTPLLDSPETAMEAVTIFSLTSPVCVAPGTWHSLVLRADDAIGGEGGTVFVCENAQVSGKRLELPGSFRCS